MGKLYLGIPLSLFIVLAAAALSFGVHFDVHKQSFFGTLYGGREAQESVAGAQENGFEEGFLSDVVFLRRFEEEKARLLAQEPRFLELHMPRGTLALYENGVRTQEIPVLAMGDPQGWGGTPAGLYNIVSKSQRAFSSISQTYMPYAVPFYGKYLLHGEPYYADGEKLDSEISGGCVRLRDEDIAALFPHIEPGIPLFVVDQEMLDYAYESVETIEPPLVTAQHYLVADLESGFVFAEQNSDKVFPIASITKLMTAVVVAEQVDLRRSVTVTNEMLSVHGSTNGLHAGERYRVVELFYPLLIQSSNQSAEAVAGFLGRARTIQLMNEKAEAIFMRDTNFADPSGLSLHNTSTPQDLYYLLRYIRNNRPPLLEISRGNNVTTFGPVRFSVAGMPNRNVFMREPSFLGGKSGYLNSPRFTGAYLFEAQTPEGDTRAIAIIMLGSGDLLGDGTKLYNWVQQQYDLAPHPVNS